MTSDQIIATGSIDLAPMFEQYRQRLVNRQRKDASIYNFVRAITPFQTWLEASGIVPEALTEDDIYAYFASPGYGYSQGTRHAHAGQIMAAYRYAHSKGTIAANPLIDFERPSNPDPEPKAIPVDELRAMLGKCTTWKQEMLWYLLTYTGLRRDEIRKLRWDTDADNRVDMEARLITVVGKGSRKHPNGKRRVVPIHPRLLAKLEAAPDNGMVSQPLDGNPKQGAVIWTDPGQTNGSGGIYSSGTALSYVKDAFAPDDGFHAFRRTVATSLRRNKVDSSTRDRIMGWAATTIGAKHYDDFDVDDLRKAINRLYMEEGL